MKLVLSIAIFSVILVGAFQRGESLKCIVCKSTNDGNCASAPDKIEARCSAVPPGPTEKPATTTETPKPSSTVTPKPSTTEKPSSTETPKPTSIETPQPTTEETQPSSSQTPAPTTGATLPSSSQTPAPTTGATDPSSSQTPAPTSGATDPSSSQTSAPTSEATLPSSSQTSAPTSGATDPSSSQTPAPTSEATLPSSSQTPPPEAPKPSEPETLNQQGPQVKKMTHRSRRQAIHVFAAETHECYKIIYKENNEEVVERGCVAKKTSCEGLKAGKSEVECNVCSDEDDCNASSMLTSSLASMLLFVGVTLYLSR